MDVVRAETHLRDRGEVGKIFGPCEMEQASHVGGVRSGAAVMQSQHGVPSTLTAAPMYGQYGDALVLLTATEQAVPALSLSPPHLPSSSCPLCLSVQRSVKCHNRWRQDTLKIPSTPKLAHHHGLFIDSNCRLWSMQMRRCGAVSLCIHASMCVFVFLQNGRP